MKWRLHDPAALRADRRHAWPTGVRAALGRARHDPDHRREMESVLSESSGAESRLRLPERRNVPRTSPVTLSPYGSWKVISTARTPAGVRTSADETQRLGLPHRAAEQKEAIKSGLEARRRGGVREAHRRLMAGPPRPRRLGRARRPDQQRGAILGASADLTRHGSKRRLAFQQRRRHALRPLSAAVAKRAR